ncbi:hypothetical protein SCUCBS95973_005628 [Sporothrix curviconia]|uniref:Zn(2)-C6 fungal-type domain-containing protein n=1 Tax=Sporothrix curviconia TaxID=1260050 RepID=A0ABP0C0G8_9PEZI
MTTAPRCLTCKERKVKCDGTLPVCINCKKANRECRAGHAFALSWPKPRSRRALEGPKSDKAHAASQGRVRQQRNKGVSGYYFVNVLSEQVAAHHLLPFVATSQDDAYLSFLPKKAPSLYADVERLQADGTGLMTYFYYEASNSIPQLDREPTQFRDLLLRMSVQDNSASSKSVLYALFSLAALRRYGNVHESSHFKGLALQSLQQAAKNEGIGPAHILQHMAAGLLLCRAEINLGEDSTVFWALYICSLRTVCGVAFNGQLGGNFKNEDAHILYRYLHYHDILAQFSVCHLQRPTDIASQLSVNFKHDSYMFQCRNRLDRFELREGLGDYLQYEISLLSRVLKASKQEQFDPEYPVGRDHQKSLCELEAELDKAFLDSKTACAGIRSVDENDALEAAEAALKMQRCLFLAATWIYFQRTCRHLTGPSAQIDALFDETFAWAEDIHRLNIRITPFSLFLIGAEANTEARRRTVMDFVHRRPELLPIASEVLSIRGDDTTPSQLECLISATWAQDDLHNDSEGYLDYVTKMQYVITARSVLPALV